MNTYERKIETGLPKEKKYGEMIASVVGQLSDGAWEGCNRVQGYWIFAECNSRDSDINVSTHYYDHEYHSAARNPYKHMTDSQIKKYFGNKLKQLVLMELEDDYNTDIEETFLKDMRFCHYIKDEEEYQHRLARCEAYKADHPWSAKGLFNAKSDYPIDYLSYGADMTVADVYKAYKILISN